MRYRPLGRSGLKVSVLALGSWLTYGGSVDEDTARACVHAALDAGINLLDTADVYAHGAAERVLGQALRGRNRQHLVLASKAYFPMSDDVNDRGLSRKHLTESVRGSLQRLGTDYLDLYQCHRFDEGTPVEEVVMTMGDFIARGAILYWGTSMWPAHRLVEACATADRLGVPRPVSNQPVYNLLDRRLEERVLPASRELGIGQLAFSPLAQGVLTGKYRGGRVPEGSRGAHERERRFLERYLTPDNRTRVDRLAGVAEEAGLPLTRLALAWVLHTEGLSSAIFGASRPDQVAENVRAADVELDGDLLAAVDAALDEG